MDAKLQINLLAAWVPVVLGIVWYNPYLLGRVWKSLTGMAIPEMSPLKFIVTVIVTYVGGYYITRIMGNIVIHQRGLYSMLANQPDVHTQGTELYNTVQGLMDKYGHNYRTFKHGAFHGYLTGLYMVTPILVITGLAEWKKIGWMLVHAAFWIASLALMGGIICAYMP